MRGGVSIAPRRADTTAVAVAYVITMFMTAMDMHIVNVALPTLSRELHAPLATVEWTVLGYILGVALLIAASGWIGDRFGSKRTFLLALSLFTLASAFCGAAQNIGELIAARVLQGIGGGMLVPLSTAMLYRAYPPERRARITRLLILPFMLGPASAPILGGLLTQDLSWRWVFLVNVPIGLVALALGVARLREHRETVPGRLDVVGFALGGGGLALVLYAVSEGSTVGWGSPAILASAGAGAIALTLFGRLERRRPDPLLNVRLLGDRLFRATNIVAAFNTGSFLAILYLTPLFLQDVQHRSPIDSGLTTFVEAIGVVCASQPVGRLYPRLGPRVLACTGAFSVAAIVLVFQLVDVSTSPWLVRVLLFALGGANCASFLSLQASMFTTISSRDTGHASAIYNTQRQVAIAVNVAIASAILAGVGGSQLVAFHAAYLAIALIALAGGLCAVTLIHTPDAAASMVGEPAGAAAGTARP